MSLIPLVLINLYCFDFDTFPHLSNCISLFSQIKALQEDLKKANADIVTNAEMIEKMASGEIKTLNVRLTANLLYL